MFIKDKHVRYFAFGMALVGILILAVIPFLQSKRVNRPDTQDRYLDKICKTINKDVQWEYIVVHHSATREGNAAKFDDYHKNTRKWKYGLAYHFVIGNGSQSKDGEIEVGSRWRKQIHGAHTSSMDYNRVAIGVCLVGNFEEENVPSKSQMNSLLRLAKYLCRKYNIPLQNVIGHNQVKQNHTVCPGKNFNLKEFKNTLQPLLLRDIDLK